MVELSLALHACEHCRDMFTSSKIEFVISDTPNVSLLGLNGQRAHTRDNVFSYIFNTPVHVLTLHKVVAVQ